jgi:hypothetical protein
LAEYTKGIYKYMASSLHNYIRETQKMIDSKGENGAEAVFDPGVSDTMILCHNIMSQYAKEKKLPKPPCPISINNKNIQGKDSYTILKFEPTIDTNLLSDIFTKHGYPNVSIEEYNMSINVEIYKK